MNKFSERSYKYYLCYYFFYLFIKFGLANKNLFNIFFNFFFQFRVKCRLENLNTSLIAWKQFESGLNEFKEALGQDKGTLEGLTGALEMENEIITNNFALDVKEVAKRLSEKIDSTTVQQVSASIIIL